MARYKFSREEQETIFRFDGNLDTVNVFTAYPAVKRKLDRLGFTPHKVSTMAGEEVGWFYHVPYALFRWGLKRKAPARSAQVVAAATERLAQARQSRSTVREVLV